MRRRRLLGIATVVVLATLGLSGCRDFHWDPQDGADSVARESVQGLLDDYREQFAERLDTGFSAEQIAEILQTEPFTSSLIGLSTEEISEHVGDTMTEILAAGADGDRVVTEIFLTARGHAGGGGSYTASTLYVCLAVAGTAATPEPEIVVTVIDCPDFVREVIVSGSGPREIEIDELDVTGVDSEH